MNSLIFSERTVAIISSAIALAPDEVHIWQCPLGIAATELNSLHALLSKDEQERVQRFHRTPSRNQFVVSRGQLRRMLSQYLAIAPQHIQFSYGAMGKPSLAPTMPKKLHFNLSHSGQMALFAVASDRRVGVDLEYAHRTLEVMALSRRYFSVQEHRLIVDCHPSQRNRLFLQLWTGKEALAKATGMGLSALEDITLSPAFQSLDAPTEVVQQETDRLLVQRLNVSSGYIAAIAIEGHQPFQLKMMNTEH